MWLGRFRVGSKGWERVTGSAEFVVANAVVKSHSEKCNTFSVQITCDISGANTWIGWFEICDGANTVINEGAVESPVCEAWEVNAMVHGEDGCKERGVREGDGVRELEGSARP